MPQILEAYAKVGHDIFMSHGFGQYGKGPFRIALLVPNEKEKRHGEDQMTRVFTGQKNVVIESVVIKRRWIQYPSSLPKLLQPHIAFINFYIYTH